jgi:hypothetical protein
VTSLIEMPFDLDGGRPFVSVENPGHDPLKFFLDTGAGFSAIDEGLAQDLRLDFGHIYCELSPSVPGIDPRHITFMCAEEKFCGDAANVQSLSIPIVDPECPWMERKPLRDQAQVDGLIGGDIFGRYIVEIDYQLRRVRFFDPQGYEATVGSETIGISVKSHWLAIYVGDGIDRRMMCPIKTNDPYVKGELIVSGSRLDRPEFLIDTGLPTSLVVSHTFSERYGILDNVESKIQSICPLASYGVGECDVGRLEALLIGDSGLKIPFPIVSFYQKPMWESSGDYDGIIGHDILRRFKIAFDYGNQRMTLERNDDFDQPYTYDMSGTYLERHEEGVKVSKLIGPSDSPAVEAGLAKGDIIIAINGEPLENFTCDQVEGMFRQEGKEYHLDVSRPDGIFKTCIRTRRLI